MEAREERIDHRLADAVLRDRQDREPPFRQGQMQALQRRHLLHAGDAPGGPEVDQQHLPAEVGEGGGGAVKGLERHARRWHRRVREGKVAARSEEHTSELQSLMRISYAVFCLKKKTQMLITTIP